MNRLPPLVLLFAVLASCPQFPDDLCDQDAQCPEGEWCDPAVGICSERAGEPADANGHVDAGPGPDAGPGADAGPDAGPADAGPADAGPSDAGPVDAGPVDAGPPDAGPVDAGTPDAGTPVTAGQWERCESAACATGFNCVLMNGRRFCMSPCIDRCGTGATCVTIPRLASKHCVPLCSAGACPTDMVCSHLYTTVDVCLPPAPPAGDSYDACDDYSLCLDGFDCLKGRGDLTGVCSKVCRANTDCPTATPAYVCVKPQLEITGNCAQTCTLATTCPKGTACYIPAGTSGYCVP